MDSHKRSEDRHLTQSDRLKTKRNFQSGSEKRKKAKECAESIAKLPKLDSFTTELPISQPVEHVLTGDLKETELKSHSSTPEEGEIEMPNLDRQDNNNTANDIGKWSSTTTEEQINYWAVKLDVNELQNIYQNLFENSIVSVGEHRTRKCTK